MLMATAFFCFVVGAMGHGMMMDPPNRSSMWRFDPSSPPNYNDNENFCGGAGIQWQTNGGKCGVCGDDWRDPLPRKNEHTGIYGRGKIGKTYQQGGTISASILLTTNHKYSGWFSFSLCKIDDETKPEKDECFVPLKTVDGKDKYIVPSTECGYYKVDLKLPAKFTCDHCTLRWHYNTGNTWGQCDDGHWETGCGPQETFRSCSDIAIF